MPTDRNLTRRRFLGISAAAAGLGLLPLAGPARAEAGLVEWQGIALGANASIRIHHHDIAVAEQALRLVLQDMRRLESVLSLYRPDSALSLLNRQGSLVAPAPELVDLLQASRQYAALTDGAFDPTIQPLWALYSRHFAQPQAAQGGPPATDIAAALQAVGLDHLLVSRDRIAFRRPGMAISLNGIAQGYVTDRVVKQLHRHGIAHTLVDMGESRALGHHPDGRPWRAMIADPLEPGRDELIVPLADAALATSGGYGFRFDAAGRFHHIFNPQSGYSPQRYRSVSVVMPTAMAADALSTAFTLMAPEAIGGVLRRQGAGRAHLITAEGQTVTIST
ncbi:FAD:protein FMN transferase [Ferrovibrio sp.]|uniref:FAD:protein FMN transferase n=1 Tax=Ferrovibrio sp. TaxID=1917215 RepID=UPI0026240FB0|nr:FAD:protein FMN transferase [Ferrovibrio sp.]